METPITNKSERIKQILHQLGRAYIEKRQFSAAREKLSLLLQLEPDHPEVIKDLTIACVGLNEVGEEAMNLYHRAVALNPDSPALKLGLATLFAKNQITTDFAIGICEEALAQSPPNEQQLRRFLASYYLHNGNPEKARMHEYLLIYTQGAHDALFQKLEQLWIEEKFPEVNTLLTQLEQKNGNVETLQRIHVLTRAYQFLSRPEALPDEQEQEAARQTMDTLQPGDSLLDFHHWLLLHSMLSRLAPVQIQPKDSTTPEEYELFLQELSLEELFQTLGRDERKDEQDEGPKTFLDELALHLNNPWPQQPHSLIPLDQIKSLLLLDLPPMQVSSADDKTQEVFLSRIEATRHMTIFQIGTGLLCFARDGKELLLQARNSFEKSLELKNKGVLEWQGNMVALFYPLANSPEDDGALMERLLELMHLWRRIQNKADDNGGATARILLMAADQWLKKQGKKVGQWRQREAVKILPGKTAAYHELIWYNPLASYSENSEFTIGQFTLSKQLSFHGRYYTFYGMNRELNRPVIARILPPEVSGEILASDETCQSFFDRIRALAAISNPFLATVYDMGESDHLLYIVREYVSGTPLHEATFEGDDREIQILQAFQKIIRGLQAIERQNLAHLNLKPGNLWLTDAGGVKITDFRLDGLQPGSDQQGVLFPAQWRYAAPEVISEHTGDSRSDIYSLGLILYELIVGKHPYDTTAKIRKPADLYRVSLGSMKAASVQNAKIWEPVVKKALQQKPENRFQNLAEFDLALREIQVKLMAAATSS